MTDQNESDQTTPLSGVDLHSLVRCWSCDGSGIGSPAMMNTAFADIPCDRCGGTGQCPAIMREWEKEGRKMKEWRLRYDLSLRECAKARCFGVVEYSRAERGLIDPTPYAISANATSHTSRP